MATFRGFAVFLSWNLPADAVAALWKPIFSGWDGMMKRKTKEDTSAIIVVLWVEIKAILHGFCNAFSHKSIFLALIVVLFFEISCVFCPISETRHFDQDFWEGPWAEKVFQFK